MFQRGHEFFGRRSDVLDAYFNLADYWHSLDFVLDLTVEELELLCAQTERIAELKKPLS